MKYVFGFLTLIMLSFVYFQYNDPDPAIWMAIYGLAALILGLATFGRNYKYVLILGHVVFGAGIVILFPSFMDWLTIEKGQNLMQRMADSKMYIEETREFLGLCIAFACISLVWIPIMKKK